MSDECYSQVLTHEASSYIFDLAPVPMSEMVGEDISDIYEMGEWRHMDRICTRMTNSSSMNDFIRNDAMRPSQSSQNRCHVTQHCGPEFAVLPDWALYGFGVSHRSIVARHRVHNRHVPIEVTFSIRFRDDFRFFYQGCDVLS